MPSQMWGNSEFRIPNFELIHVATSLPPQCPLLNVSFCPPLETDLSKGGSVVNT